MEPSSALWVPHLRVSEGPSRALAGHLLESQAREKQTRPRCSSPTRSRPCCHTLHGPHRPLLLGRRPCPPPATSLLPSPLKGNEKYLNITGVLGISVFALDSVKNADSQAHPRPLETRSAFWADARVILGAHGRLRRAGLGDSPYP